MDCTLRSRCHLPRSVYHLACSRSRCVITLALLVSCWRYLQLSRLAGQLYVDVSRVRQGMDASGCATHVPIGEAYDVHSRALNWRLPYVCVRCISWRLSSQLGRSRRMDLVRYRCGLGSRGMLTLLVCRYRSDGCIHRGRCLGTFAACWLHNLHNVRMPLMPLASRML